MTDGAASPFPNRINVFSQRLERVIVKEMEREGKLDLAKMYRENASFADDLEKFFDMAKNEKEIELRVDEATEVIEARLNVALTPQGKIDAEQLSEKDPNLFEALEQFALSKTWRDDPNLTARDIARLLEARSSSTLLGEAITKLSEEIDNQDL